jgi:hypothetical protein
MEKEFYKDCLLLIESKGSYYDYSIFIFQVITR